MKRWGFGLWVTAWALAGAAFAQDAGTAAPVDPPAATAAQPDPGTADAGQPEGAQAQPERGWPAVPLTTEGGPAVPPEGGEPVVEQGATTQPSPEADTPRRRRRRGEPERSMNTVSMNAVGAISGYYAFGLERALTDRFSFNIEALVARAHLETTRGPSTVNGLGLTVALRWFLWGKAPGGAYVSPAATIFNFTVQEAVGGASGTAGGGGVYAGYAHLFWDTLYVGAEVGAEGYVGPVSLAGSEAKGWSWAPRLKLNIGVAF